jgi:hypothetical protein
MSRERERTIEVEPPWLQRGRSVVSDVCTRIRHCPGPLADFMLPTHPGRRTSWGRHIGYTLSIPPVSRPPLSEAQENDISILINPRPGPRHCVDRLSSYSHRIALRYLAFPSDPWTLLLSLVCHWTTSRCASGSPDDRRCARPIASS